MRAHLQNVDRLIAIQRARVEGLEEEFQQEVQAIEAEFQLERDQLTERHALEKRELQLIVQQVQRSGSFVFGSMASSSSPIDKTLYWNHLRLLQFRFLGRRSSICDR